MKVVCDNCQAVYKIADNKLVKEINRATCKRCGHKIIIFQHNPASARSTLMGQVAPVSEAPAAGQSQAGQSQEDIEKLAQMTGSGLPSLGSLTKELRAISSPAPAAAAASIGPEQTAGPPAPVVPAAIPAAPSAAPPGTGVPGLRPPTGATADNPVVSADNGVSSAAVRGADLAPPPPPPPPPASAIPPSDSPATKVYRGPSPTGPVLSAAASQSAVGAGAVPSLPDSDTTAPHSYPPPVESPGPAPLAVPPSVPVPGVVQGVQTAALPSPAPAPGSPLLGTAGLMGALSFVGLLLVILVPGVVSTVGYVLAGFGAASTMALALVTEKGRLPEKQPIGLVLGLAMGIGCGGLALAIQSLDASSETSVETVASSTVAPPPPVAVGQPALAAAGDAGDLAAEEALPGGEQLEQSDLAAVAEQPAGPADPAPAARADSRPTVVGSKRASKRSSNPPVFPELSAESRAELQDIASSNSSIGSTEQRRSRSSAQTSRTRSSRQGIARSEPTTSYSGSSSDRRASDSVASASASRKRRAVPKAPKEKSAAATATGPNEFIIKTIIGSNKAIKRCISSQRSRDPDLSGKIYVKFKLAPSGQVSRARVTTSRYAGTALDTCISREVNALEFPPFSGKSTNVTYPLLVVGD